MKKRKLLVANRSEIACRIFQAAREKGIEAIGMVAPGDESARHVTFADRIISVPSYMDADAIVRAAVNEGVDLIHPGYGFLSERAHFAEMIEKAGIQFLGPRADTISLMGGKIPSKELAAREGVPTLPWAKIEMGEKSQAQLRSEAKRIGYPLLLKASAGGGGKGMRLVKQESELESAAESACAEAQSSFGDGTLFLEKYIESARHIEVQVFGDGLGGGVHLFDRECSLQRRHQKVWEEAPAPDLSEETRNGLYSAALKLVKATRYRSAGTVEFLVEGNDPQQKQPFYFLEMNTRLQVEHPVTEMVTGIDLVHAQIDLAMEPNLFPMKDVPPPRGHSIEVRLYAENPAQGFIPTPGQVAKLRWPSGPGIRIDSGIEEGQVVNVSFDSMLAKLIVWAPSRSLALVRLQQALAETVILGMGHNQSYLQAIAAHPDVQNGKVDTDWLRRVLGNFKGDFDSSDFECVEAMKKEGLLGFPVQGVHNHTFEFPSPWMKQRNGR